MIVLLKMQTKREIYVKFLYVQYLFSKSPQVMKEQGEHEEKMYEVNFYRGRREWGEQSTEGAIFEMLCKRWASPCLLSVTGKFYAN